MIRLLTGSTHTGKTLLAQRLLERGLTEEMVMNLYWNNALGVMDAAVRNNKK